MKFIPVSVTRTIARQRLITEKNAPKILFVAGVAGAIGSTVLACRATLKLEDVLIDAQKDLSNTEEVHQIYSDKYSEQDVQEDRIHIYVRTAGRIFKLYGPSVALGVASIACLTKSHNMLTKRNAALTAAYATLDQAFSNYRQSVVDEVGEEREQQIRYKAEKTEVSSSTGKKKSTNKATTTMASPYSRWFDRSCVSWSPYPEYSEMFLDAQQKYANDLLHGRGHLLLNDVYDMLGFERTTAGAVVGWVIGEQGDEYVDFGCLDRINGTRNELVWRPDGSVLLDFNVDGIVYDKLGD